jgi:aminoglycoside phosphotransferase (APT) family kinase protein
MDHPGHTKDLAAVERRLVRWLERALPAAARVRVADLRSPSSTGFSSETLLFNLEYEDGAGGHREPLVARLAPSEFAVFPNYDLMRQAWVMRTLAATDVPVPRVRFCEAEAEWLGTPFYVMDHVDGRVPSDVPPMHVGGWVTELSDSQREAMWWSGLDAMARVHNLGWQSLGFAQLEKPMAGLTPLQQQLHEYDQFFSWGLERARFAGIESALTFLRTHQPTHEPVALCWGDARLGNQIFQDQTCVAVLDWEMANLGNPVADLAWWIALDRCFSEGVGAARLPGFPDRDATLARWEQLTGRRAEHLVYYEIFALFRFHIILSRIVQQMKRVGILSADDPYDADNMASQVLARALADAGA